MNAVLSERFNLGLETINCWSGGLLSFMKYILQVFNGSWNEAEASPEEIIRKIDDISSRIPVSQVIRFLI